MAAGSAHTIAYTLYSWLGPGMRPQIFKKECKPPLFLLYIHICIYDHFFLTFWCIVVKCSLKKTCGFLLAVF